MLRVGTDCSGLESPIWALRQLGVDFVHVFSSETDENCRRTIQANCSPQVMYGDVLRREVRSTPPCDLYVAGFPCQPFSLAGSLKGTDDPRGRVFPACLSYIKTHLPTFFVLENVKNLLHIEEGRVFQNILRELEGVGGYTVSHSVLNTKDYGIPQSRNRLYIVGRRSDRPFCFPPPSPSCPPPERFVDYSDESKTTSSRATECRRLVLEMRERGIPCVFFDELHMQRGKKDKINKAGYPVSPCVTSNSYHWNSVMDRRVNVKELLALQGLPTDLRIVVSETAIRKQIGNAMSVNVLMSIFDKLLSEGV